MYSAFIGLADLSSAPAYWFKKRLTVVNLCTAQLLALLIFLAQLHTGLKKGLQWIICPDNN